MNESITAATARRVKVQSKQVIGQESTKRRHAQHNECTQLQEIHVHEYCSVTFKITTIVINNSNNAEIIRLWCASRPPACSIGHNSTSNFIFDTAVNLLTQTFSRGEVICREIRLLVAYLGQFLLFMCKIGCNSTVINEPFHPDFLTSGVISTKLRRLTSVLADFHVFDLFGAL
jgi:hypothetical protein